MIKRIAVVFFSLLLTFAMLALPPLHSESVSASLEEPIEDRTYIELLITYVVPYTAALLAIVLPLIAVLYATSEP